MTAANGSYMGRQLNEPLPASGIIEERGALHLFSQRNAEHPFGALAPAACPGPLQAPRAALHGAHREMSHCLRAHAGFKHAQ